MMSDTYQRIQAQSDKEWKFGRAILIRQMNKRSATPSPINMLTKLYIVIKVAYRNRCKCLHAVVNLRSVIFSANVYTKGANGPSVRGEH